MKKTSKIRFVAIALIIILGLVFLNLTIVSSTIKNFFYSLSSPIGESIGRAAKQAKDGWKFLSNLKNISKENSELNNQIQELTSQNIKLKEFEQENEFLRSYLNLPIHQKYQFDLANIIGRDFQGLEKYILINKGKTHGIEKNMPVVAFENILVGKIVEVFDDFSKALLITSSNSKIPVMIQESRIEGLIQGFKKNLLIIDLIPKDVEVNKDQTVITTGINSVFPKGLLVGQISSVKFFENAIFQEIKVKIGVDIENLERVFIIKN